MDRKGKWAKKLQQKREKSEDWRDEVINCKGIEVTQRQRILKGRIK